MKNKLIVVAAALLATTLVAGCDTGNSVNTSPDKAGAQNKNKDQGGGGGNADSGAAKIGDPVTIKGSDTSLQVTAMKVVPFTQATNSFEKPGKGKRFVAVQFQLSNVGKKAYDDAPTNGSVVIDPKGQQFQATFISGIKAGPLFPATIKIVPGGKALGYVAYEVPLKAKIAQVQYAMDSGFSDSAQWNVH